MDFHSLSRRELQSLCKLNKIPANITNVAMADALQSLEIVEGIEEFLNVSKSETADSVESMEKVEVSSTTKVPQSRCRTSTRQKVKIVEAETATRTTRRGSKQLAGEVQESKNDMQTPALSSTRRKALATSSCQNVNRQLNECEEEADKKRECAPSSLADSLTNNRRKRATASTTLKKENTVQKAYSTRRSTRLTEVKSTEPRAKKESATLTAVKINSFLDEVDVTSKEVLGESVEISKNTVPSVNPNAELEDICNAFEKDLIIEATHTSEEKEDSGELDNLTPEPDETSNPCENGDLEEKLKIEEKFDLEEKDRSEAENNEVQDLKPESDGVSIPSEHEDSKEKVDLDEKLDAIETSSEAISGDNIRFNDHNHVMVTEEHFDNTAGFESVVAVADEIDAEENFSDTPDIFAVSEMNQVPESNGSSTDLILSNTNESSELDNENTKDVKNAFENIEVDVNPTIDYPFTIAVEEVQDLMVEHLTETNVKEETHGFEGSSITVDNVVSTIEEKDQFSSNCVMPIKKVLSRTPTSSLKQMSIVLDDKENMDSGRKLQVVFVEDDGGKEEEKKKKDEILTEISIRQLRKQVKALTLKNINANEDHAPTTKEEATITRPALQALCTNQLAN